MVHHASHDGPCIQACIHGPPRHTQASMHACVHPCPRRYSQLCSLARQYICYIYIYIYNLYIYIYPPPVYPPTSSGARALSHSCNRLIPSNPVNSNQQLPQYLAIGHHRLPQSATGATGTDRPLQPPSPDDHGIRLETTGGDTNKQKRTASVCIQM